MRLGFSNLHVVAFSLICGLIATTCFAEAPITSTNSPSSNTINVRQLGAIGNGTTNDSPAFQLALDTAIQAQQAVIYIPAGTYLLEERVVAEFDGKHGTGITIRGDGTGVSVIVCSNEEGALKIRDRYCRTQVHLEDLSFYAAIQGAGTAIEVSSPPRGVRNYRTCTIDDVEVRGMGVPTRYYFDRGYNITGQWRPLLTNCIFSGILDPSLKHDPEYDAIADDSLFYAPEYGFAADWSYAPTFENCYAWSCKTGFRIVSLELKNTGPEDSAFYRCTAVRCLIGIHIDTTILEPQLVIDSCHINCRDTGILLNKRKFFHITNCLMYSEWSEEYPYMDISINESYGGLIAGNQFHSPSPTNLREEPPSNRVGINVGENCRDLLLTDNLFNAKGKAIAVAPNAKRVKGSGNSSMNRWAILDDKFN